MSQAAARLPDKNNEDEQPGSRGRAGTRKSTRTCSRNADATAWLAPSSPAKLSSNGNYLRPKEGPPVEGYSWNNVRGVWIPSKRLQEEMEIRQAQSLKTQRSQENASQKRKKAAELSLLEDVDTSSGSASFRNASVARRSAHPPERKRQAKTKQPKQKDAPSRRTDSLRANGGNKTSVQQKSVLGATAVESATENFHSQDIEIVEEEPDQKDHLFHQTSVWKEPIPKEAETELTLYEKHRRPRPAPAGKFTCSIKELEEEFRCVICLGCIRNALIVRECLHRFCERCIEKFLLQVGQRKECPVCRVPIPSHRSLVPDPSFDSLVSHILPHMHSERSAKDDEAQLLSSRTILQRAIQQKKESSTLQISNVGRGSSPQRKTPPPTKATEKPSPTELTTDFIPPLKTTPPPLVKIKMIRDRSDHLVADLSMPYLTIAGDAPINVLKEFLHRKHGFLYSFEIWSVLRSGQPEILEDSMQVQYVPSSSRSDYMPFYYRTVV